jgi:tetratricopeptide (TPR) repeat protein
MRRSPSGLAALPLMKPFLFLVTFSVVLSAADPSVLEKRKTQIRDLLEKQEFSSAFEQAKAFNRDCPDDVAGYQLIVAADLALGNYNDAEKQLQWMLDLRIGKADSYGWLLVARFREITGDVDGAIDAINLAYGRLDPGHEQDGRMLLAYSGRLQMLAGRQDLADRVLTAAGGAASAEPSAIENLARLRLAQGKRDQAIQLLRTLTKATPNPRYLYLLADATHDARDYQAFEQAARSQTKMAGNANRELVLYLSGPGKNAAEAVEIARRESASRHDIFTMDALAVALVASGKTAEGSAVMRKVLSEGTRDPEILAHAASMGVKPAVMGNPE